MKDIQQIIVHVLQNEVSEEEMAVFLDWFHSSQENKDLFFQLKNIYDHRKGGLMPDSGEMEASWNRLIKKLENNPQHIFQAATTKSNRVKLKRWQAVAAVFVGLLLVGASLFYGRMKQNSVWVEVRTTSSDPLQIVQLPDGSSVQLNVCSFLKYPKRFTGKKRQVYLDGEAIFDVKNDGRSFEVQSDKQQIVVLGTQFNVMDYSKDSYAVTTLIHGKIELKTFDVSNNIKNRMVLTPKQQVLLDKNTDYVTLSEVDPNDIISWTTGMYSFEDVPLEQITGRLEKMYNVTIVIPDEKSRKEKYTGKFSSSQAIEEIIQIINFKGQFEYYFRNDTIVLQRK
jgi:transmembrane sensor